jgi:hypothetical protein
VGEDVVDVGSAADGRVQGVLLIVADPLHPLENERLTVTGELVTREAARHSILDGLVLVLKETEGKVGRNRGGSPRGRGSRASRIGWRGNFRFNFIKRAQKLV